MAKDTRARILDTALTLFSENGYAGTNIRELTASLGLVKSALYRHFKSKQELVDDEFEDYMLTCGVPSGDYYEVRHFFETYLTDKEVRRAIEDKKFQRLGTEIPSYTFADLKRLGQKNMNSVVGYVNDNVNLSRFM